MATVSDSPRRRVWQLAWPMIVSNLSIPLLGLVDTAILGHLPTPRHLAAVALGASILSLVLWSFGFLRMGTTSLVARHWGAGERSQIAARLKQSWLLAGALGLVLLLVREPLLQLALWVMQPPPELLADVSLYGQIRLLSAPAVLLNFTLIGACIGLQNARIPLRVLLVTNLVNILLDTLFILGFGWGSEGAAWASVVADYSGLLLALISVRQWLRRCAIPLVGGLNGGWRGMGRLLRINGHLFLRTACLLTTLAFFTLQGALQGPTILAANAIVLQLLLLVSYGLDGFAHAAEALMGDATGRGQRGLALSVLRLTGLWSLLVAVLFTLLFMLFQPLWMAMLTDIPAVHQELEQIFFWLWWLPLVSVWGYWLDGVFIGAGRTDLMLRAMAVATALVFLPVWWLSRGWGNQGLWLAMTLFNGARGLLLGVMISQTLQLAAKNQSIVTGRGGDGQERSPETTKQG